MLYGCGDLINDYEGIGGHERFRGDLRLLYLSPGLDPAGRLEELQLLPFQSRQLRLRHATEQDVGWLHRVLNKACSGYGSRVDLAHDAGLLLLR